MVEVVYQVMGTDEWIVYTTVSSQREGEPLAALLWGMVGHVAHVALQWDDEDGTPVIMTWGGGGGS